MGGLDGTNVKLDLKILLCTIILLWETYLAIPALTIMGGLCVFQAKNMDYVYLKLMILSLNKLLRVLGTMCVPSL